MPELPVTVTADKSGTARFTLTCRDCGGSTCLTITDVPPFTLSVAKSLFTQVMGSDPKTTRLSVKCSSCEAIAARQDDRRENGRHSARVP